MKVLVDTSVWSLALRRKEKSEISKKLADLIIASLAVMIGPVRQELLSGISNEDAFLKLKAKLEAFDDFPITTQEYATAAEFYNTCRKHGKQGSHIDFLVCAVAYNNDLYIFTTDDDYYNYAEHLPIRLL
ncbi:MAG: PIN domain-containing protein [Synergistaceae bacterium]|nr:PIN domain-containing protein [Synergistaceae bacterium]